MTYSPPATGQPDPMVLSSMTDDVSAVIAYTGGNGATSAWTANLAVFVPVRLTQRHTYIKAFWVNGSAVAGNVDVGIYTLSGTTLTRVVASTAEAQATINVLQVATTFTTTTIGPGVYYLALSSTSTTSQFWRGGTQSITGNAIAGAFQVATASPLPTTATTAAAGTQFVVPVFGFSENAAI